MDGVASGGSGCGSSNVASQTPMTQMFKIVFSFIILFMQAGFALFEAGSTGSTATTSILFKNLLDVVVGCLAWFVCGYAFAFGESDNSFVGSSGFFLYAVDKCEYANWVFTMSFAATATTIVSGPMAGRTRLLAYCLHSILLTGWVYPVIVKWVWSENAWLAGNESHRFRDFAGSGVVHITGGTAGLVGCIMVGPRGTRIFENFENKADIPGHSMPLASTGLLILWMGFMAFNGGSVEAFDTIAQSTDVALAVVNTNLSAAGGGMAALLANRFIVRRKYWSLTQMCNGMLGGMVAICAGANTVHPWAAVVIGILSGCTYMCWSVLLHRQGIDDAIDGVAVHLGCGIWGVVATAFFAHTESIFYDSSNARTWDRVGWAVIGVIVIVAWTAFWSLLAFSILRRYNLLRVSDDAIDEGLDIVDHGESAYVFTAIARDSQRPWGPIDMRIKGMHNGNSALPIGNDLRHRRANRSGTAPPRTHSINAAMTPGTDMPTTTTPTLQNSDVDVLPPLHCQDVATTETCM